MQCSMFDIYQNQRKRRVTNPSQQLAAAAARTLTGLPLTGMISKALVTRPQETSTPVLAITTLSPCIEKEQPCAILCCMQLLQRQALLAVQRMRPFAVDLNLKEKFTEVTRAGGLHSAPPSSSILATMTLLFSEKWRCTPMMYTPACPRSCAAQDAALGLLLDMATATGGCSTCIIQSTGRGHLQHV